jgi:hypothetical protein
VVFGATVELEDMDSGGTVTYQIVGDDEADIKVAKISLNSPVARALIGKFAGDVAEVQTPGGVREYEILDVKYSDALLERGLQPLHYRYGLADCSPSATSLPPSCLPSCQIECWPAASPAPCFRRSPGSASPAVSICCFL